MLSVGRLFVKKELLKDAVRINMDNIKPVTRRFFDENMTKKYAELCSELGVSVEVVYGMKWNIADRVTTEPLNSKMRTKLNLEWIERTMTHEG